MTNSLMLSQMGSSLVGSWGNYAMADIGAQMKETMRNYQNNISQLNASLSLNAVTINEARTQDAHTQTQIAIQQQGIRDQGDAEVAAAAAGVKGNSVDMVNNDLKASEGKASYAARRQANQQMAEHGATRTSIAVGAILNKDVSVIPKPSVGSLLLGASTQLLDIYDSHQPTGSRLLGPNGGKVNSNTLL